MAKEERLELLGFWTLASWDTVFRDGRTHPYCRAPIGGFLQYSSEGTMAVSIFKRESAEILSTYGGRFEKRGGSVVHYPWEGQSPQGIGQAKVRHVKLASGQMTMETDWTQGDAREEFLYRLQWIKCEGPQLPA